MKSSKYWADEEMAVVHKAALGGITRTEAYTALAPRSKSAIDKKIGRERGGQAAVNPTALAANDPGYDDGQEWRACVDAGEGSAALLAALARWHPERILV